MPIYEYRCNACGTGFEELIRNSRDQQSLKCSACGSTQVEQILSVPAAPHIASAALPQPSCGRCGMAPGSCQNDS